ncbi:heavy-metal-associated domain-containing protein [Thiomonas sp.]
MRPGIRSIFPLLVLLALAPVSGFAAQAPLGNPARVDPGLMGSLPVTLGTAFGDATSCGANPVATKAVQAVKPVAGTAVAVIYVPDMTCGLCPLILKTALGHLNGVLHTTADPDTRTVTVAFQPARTSVHAVEKTIVDAGYQARLRTLDGKTCTTKSC